MTARVDGVRPRVKLCAIAQNEGPYLLDWVFHHLHFGFDGVEVWINGSDDTSVEIMEAIGTARKEVTFRVVDRLLEDSLRRGRYFQYRAYARLARRAAREGYTHAAFLDLDEYWLPRSFAGGIHDFLPDSNDVNVVSFQWCLDVPRPDRPAFAHPLSGDVEVQHDPHVKSVVRLDERITQIRPHTARTTGGTRLLARDAFPLVSEEEQQWGSFVPADYFAANRSRLPAAFVLHAVNRSQTEYVASLLRPQRTSTTDSLFRNNRHGFVARSGPATGWPLLPSQRERYFRARERFRQEVDVDAGEEEARSFASRRAATVVDAVVVDPLLMERLRGALHGVSAPALDQRYPGWDYHLEWCVDEVMTAGGAASVRGWAFTDAPGRDLEFALRDAGGGLRRPSVVSRSPRPDVAHVHPAAPTDSGFQIQVPEGLPLGSATRLLARPTGSSVWSSLPLSSHLAGRRTNNP